MPATSTREHLSGATKASEYLVRDKEHIVHGAELTQLFQELDGMDDHTSGTLDKRLDDNCRNFLILLREQAPQVLRIADS